MEERRARMAAMAGIQRAMAVLASRTQPVPTTLLDEWATVGGEGAANKFILGGGSFRLEIVDAASRINLNRASQEQLERLPLTTEQIDSLLDYREDSRQPRVEGGKDDYYNNLSTPYNAKLAPFDTVDELLQVKGFTANILYEPQTETVNSATVVAGSAEDQPSLAELVTVDSASAGTTSTGQPKVNLNSGQANAALLTQRLGDPALALRIVLQRTTGGAFTSMGQVIRSNMASLSNETTRALLDNFRIGNATVDVGKINLNTATEPVLNTVPNMLPDIASAIVSRQSAGFESLGNLFDIPGYTVALAAQTADLFAVDSTVYLVRCVGQVGTTRVALEAVISLEDETPRIVRIEHPPHADVEARWGWADETTADVVLKEEA
jgi:general secretion pathway protein K